MLILKEPTIAEFTVKNSRFLSEAIPVDSPERAREIWREQKAKYDNGGHIVYAFIVGPQGNIMGCSDDGEPSGTAGRPALTVLKGSGITNVIVTIARWFGGTKLGTGGLVHAYTESAQLALENAVTEELIPMISTGFTLSYALYETTKRILDELQVRILNEDFADTVHFSVRLKEETMPELQKRLSDLTNGKVSFE
ncbi:MAG: YigZ family protein [Lentisphaeria bacterium]|nr:YigZ family protein [Lentisphaeria bacterium]